MVFWKTVNFEEKNGQTTKIMKKYPAYKELKVAATQLSPFIA